jgi:uncharacterized membrane protein
LAAVSTTGLKVISVIKGNFQKDITMATKTTVVKARPKATEAKRFNDKGIQASQCCTIEASADDLYRFWRKLENLPLFMSHLESVRSINDKTSHWKAHAPFDREVEWDAEIIVDEPGKRIAWRTLQNSDVENAGSVTFTETGDRGTEVRVVIDYIPPAGKLGQMLAKLIGEDPSANLREDLRRLKQLVESGEIATNHGPRGTCGNEKNAVNNDGGDK